MSLIEASTYDSKSRYFMKIPITRSNCCIYFIFFLNVNYFLQLQMLHSFCFYRFPVFMKAYQLIKNSVIQGVALLLSIRHPERDSTLSWWVFFTSPLKFSEECPNEIFCNSIWVQNMNPSQNYNFEVFRIYLCEVLNHFASNARCKKWILIGISI